MGWKTHEWTWRFQGKAAAAAPIGTTVETGYGAIALVATDIEQLYNTNDIGLARSIVKKYHIQYIYVGALEHQTYPNLQVQKFYELGHVVFQSNDSLLFGVN